MIPRDQPRPRNLPIDFDPDSDASLFGAALPSWLIIQRVQAFDDDNLVPRQDRRGRDDRVLERVVGVGYRMGPVVASFKGRVTRSTKSVYLPRSKVKLASSLAYQP